MYEWTITHIFDDFLINDDLLAYTPKDWRYAIPQTIEEAKKLIVKTIVKCRDSTDWMSYNYLKSLYLIDGCKAEILDFLQSDQEAITA